jgi:uncharacterized protein
LKKKFKKFFGRYIARALYAFFLSACSTNGGDLLNKGVGLPASSMWILEIVILVTMTLGLVGLFFVVVPGLTIIWMGALIYGILIGFSPVSIFLFIIITLLMIFGNMLDQLVMGAKAKKSGASWTSVLVSTGAAFIFSLLFPPFGGLVAALISLMVLEMIRLKNWRKAAQSSKEMAIGCLSAVVLRFIVGLVMIGMWIIWAGLSGQSIFSP